MEEKGISHNERYLVPAVSQAAQVLFCLARTKSPHLSLIEICRRLNIHKSKAFSILHTLQKFGLVQRDKGKGYSLGPGLIELSRRFLDNLNAPLLAEPILEDLANKSGGTAALGLIVDQNVFVVAKHEGNRAIGITMRIGHRFPITYGCHGKAIAAFLPKADLNHLLQKTDLYFYGDPSKFDRAKLEKEIAKCRKDWYAVDTEETASGLNAAAAPVIGPNNRPIGYIVIIGLPSKEAAYQLGPIVAEAGKKLSQQLGAKVDEV